MRGALFVLNILLLALAGMAETSTIARTGDYSGAPLMWLTPSIFTALTIYYPSRALRGIAITLNVLLGVGGMLVALMGAFGALSPGGGVDMWQLFLGLVLLAVAVVNFEGARTAGATQEAGEIGAKSI